MIELFCLMKSRGTAGSFKPLIRRVVPARAEFKTAPVECGSVGRGLTLETGDIGYLDVTNTR